jgi:homoserine/homoserine lactone efflux protein
VSDTAWAIAGGMSRRWLMAPARAKIMQRISGAVLVGGGVWLSLARRPVG